MGPEVINKKILFAEHESLISEIITPILESKGYEVSVARDSESVLRALLETQPNLIVIDANLAEGDGFQICKMLKADFMTSHIPIIVLIEKRQARKKMLEIEHGIDDYLIKPPDPIDLEIRIEMALRRTEHQMWANSLTKLPGSKEIEKVIADRLLQGLFSFAYIDIDNFKAFNDVYGYFQGDAVIIQLAHIISSVVKALGNKDDFVGHVGGDDFTVITTPEKESLIASKIISEFDRLMAFHYNKEDRLKKFIAVKDRAGILKDVPLMSISVAVVNNKNSNIHNIIELSEIAFEIKKYLKSLSGSNFLINRRIIKQEDGEAGSDSGLSKTTREAPKKVFIQDKPLGQLLIDKGLITQEKLNDALRRHWLTAQPLGKTLVNTGLITQKDLEEALRNKQENPVS